MYARIAVANAAKNIYHFQLLELGKIKQILAQFYPMFQPILAQLTAFQQQRAAQGVPPSATSPAEAAKLQRGLRVEDLKQPPLKRQRVTGSGISSPSPAASQQAPTPQQDPKTPATPANVSSPRPPLSAKRSATKKTLKRKPSVSKADEVKVELDKKDDKEEAENALGIKLGEDMVARRRLEAEAGRSDPLGFISQSWGELEKTETNDWLAGLGHDLQRAAAGGTAMVEAAALESPFPAAQPALTFVDKVEDDEAFDYSLFIDDSALSLDTGTMPTPELVAPPNASQELSPDSDTAVSPPSPVIIATRSPPQESVCLGESLEDQWFNGFGNGGWKWEGDLEGGSWAIEGINA